MSRLPVSVLIIAQNEERVIARCLNSVAWADEILLIEGGSTDQTLAICHDPNAAWASKIRVLSNPWTGFKNQRNFALAHAHHEWVFVIDSDEACSPELAARIQELLNQKGGPPLKAYKVRRQEYFLGRAIQYGVWNPSYQDRFFSRSGIEYVNEIHEYPRFLTPPGRIHQPIDHDPGFGPERFLTKMNRYTTQEARDRVEAGQRTFFIRVVLAGPAMFLKNYFYYSAYKDGIHGLVISVLEGISRAVRHIKIWQYQNWGTQDVISRQK